jgi:hypothetical protein
MHVWRRVSDLLLFGSIALYAASLLTPVYYTGYNVMSNAHIGLEALILGPIGLLTGQASWLANPLLWGAWRVRKSKLTRQPVAVAVAALLIAGTFLLSRSVAVGSAGETPFRVGLGYWLWLASIACAAASALAYGSLTQPAQANAA